MTNEELGKISACCALLPPPGEEVVRQLLHEIDRLRKENIALREEMQRREDYIGESEK